jgi:hypothetical protein
MQLRRTLICIRNWIDPAFGPPGDRAILWGSQPNAVGVPAFQSAVYMLGKNDPI